MINPKITVFILIIATLCFSKLSYSADNCAKIYYMSFGIDTYVPVKTTDIEKLSHKRFTICEEQKLTKLLNMLKEVKLEHKPDYNIRMKVKHNKHIYYFSIDGICSMGGKYFKFSPDEVEKYVQSLL